MANQLDPQIATVVMYNNRVDTLGFQLARLCHDAGHRPRPSCHGPVISLKQL